MKVYDQFLKTILIPKPILFVTPYCTVGKITKNLNNVYRYSVIKLYVSIDFQILIDYDWKVAMYSSMSWYYKYECIVIHISHP